MSKVFDLVPAVECAAMKRVKTLIESVASKKMPVLIYGEAGSGKTFWAKYIHQNSLFSEFPFVRLSCRNLELDEFLQALSVKSTLYLQDFSELSDECQAALFDAMNFGDANFRLIVSSRCNLEEKVGVTLAQNLYNALSLMPISIPPLRERHEDALFLAEFFLKDFAEKAQKDFTTFSDSALSEIYYGFWRVNIRELKNCVKNAVKSQEPPTVLSLNAKKTQFLPLKDAVKSFKKDYICEVFQAAGRKQGETAKILKLQRTYLSKLMKDLDVK